MSHWCCACHTTSHCNVPFPAPATQSHAPTLPGCFNHLPPNVALVLRLPRNVTLQRTCNVFPAPATQTHTPTLPGCFDTAPATSHCNAPFPAPATQSHAPTLPGCFNHLPPNVTVLRLPHNVTLQRTCNVPFPAPATQSHAPTLPGCFNRLRLPPNVTLVLRLPHNVTIQRTIPCTSHTDPRCNWKCHVHKRANFTCTSEPISRVQANPRPKSNLICEAGCGLRFHSRIILGSFSDHAGIMLGSCSEHARIGPALDMTFHLFLEIIFEILQCHFSWQAQNLVRLDGDTCCSAHCK